MFAGQAEPTRAGAAGDDQGASLDALLAEIERKGPLGQISRNQLLALDIRAKTHGLLLHILDQLWTLDPFGKARKILHQGGERELAAGFVALQHQRLQIGARRVDGGSEAGASATQYHRVSNLFCHGKNWILT